MEYLKIWVSFREVTECLADDEKGRLFDAMLAYAETAEPPQGCRGMRAAPGKRPEGRTATPGSGGGAGGQAVCGADGRNGCRTGRHRACI